MNYHWVKKYLVLNLRSRIPHFYKMCAKFENFRAELTSYTSKSHYFSALHCFSGKVGEVGIERWLTKKFRAGFHEMQHAFKEVEEDGELVTRTQFLRVLKEFGLMLKDAQLDSFLARYSILPQSSGNFDPNTGG